MLFGEINKSITGNSVRLFVLLEAACESNQECETNVKKCFPNNRDIITGYYFEIEYLAFSFRLVIFSSVTLNFVRFPS